MARTSKKKYQLVVEGNIYSYEKEFVSKTTLITKQEFEILKPLLKDISNFNNNSNWSSNDKLVKNAFDSGLDYIINESFIELYPFFQNDKEVQRLVMKFFPESGHIDEITKISYQEVKEVENFL